MLWRPSATADGDFGDWQPAYNALGDQRGRVGNDDPNDPQSSIAAWRHDLSLIGARATNESKHAGALRS